jgi:putative sterol carrier protein
MNRPASAVRALAAAAVALCAALAAPQIARADDAKNTTPQQVFDGMRKSFSAEKAKGVHASYQWNISGPDGGTWFIVVDDGKCNMGRGTTPNPDVTFTVSDKDWVAISNNELGGTWAFVTGRLKIKGPQSVAKKLDGMFP